MDIFSNKWFIAFMQFEYPVKWVALVLFLASLLFKLSIFPFYKWVPDVYEGSSWYVLNYISTVPKIAVLIWLIEWSRVFEGAELYYYIWVVLSISTMLVSNTAAVLQNSIKRLMAYSTIAQMGFVSLVLIGGGREAYQSAFFYLMVYITSVPVLYFILNKFQEDFKVQTVEDLNGRGKINPVLGVLMLVVLASLVGLPLTGGFFAKIFVFSSVYSNYQSFEFSPIIWALIVGVISTVVSLFYYLKIPYAMFINGSKETSRILTWNSQFDSVFVFLLSIMVVGMFFFPQKMMNFLQLLISYL
jgi:NADH-quinone oxidoreductase subunit N